MERNQLTKILQRCSLALGVKGSVTDNFYFKDNKIISFDGDLAVVGEFDHELNCGFSSKLLTWLKNQKGQKVTVKKLSANNYRWQCGRASIRLAYVNPDDLVFKLPDGMTLLCELGQSHIQHAVNFMAGGVPENSGLFVTVSKMGVTVASTDNIVICEQVKTDYPASLSEEPILFRVPFRLAEIGVKLSMCVVHSTPVFLSFTYGAVCHYICIDAKDKDKEESDKISDILSLIKWEDAKGVIVLTDEQKQQMKSTITSIAQIAEKSGVVFESKDGTFTMSCQEQGLDISDSFDIDFKGHVRKTVMVANMVKLLPVIDKLILCENKDPFIATTSEGVRSIVSVQSDPVDIT